MKNNEMENNSNIRKNGFKEDELKSYVKSGDLKETDVNVILEYQKLLPVLQEKEGSWIDGRILHEQLGVGKDYTTWIRGRIEKYEFIEDADYKICSPKLGSKIWGGHNKMDYSLTIDMAKELSMVENNEIGRAARKYFIAIDKAFKSRRLWNLDRWETLEHFKNYRRILRLCADDLIDTMPEWYRINGIAGVYMGEANLLNEIIVGMSASDYKFRNCLKKTESIRNHFNNFELQMVAELERFDADLIRLQEMYDYSERRELLNKKYQSLCENCEEMD